jgi:hypothetical protein
LNDKKLDSLIFDLARGCEIDVLIFGESPYTPNELLFLLNSEKADYYYSPNIFCQKIQFYSKFETDITDILEETSRIVARKISSSKYENIIFIAAHYNSKVNWTNEDQAANAPVFKELIDSVEVKSGHQRTVICGDFNMNPFDHGMVQCTGLHAVMDKKVASKRSRSIEGRNYDFFYNPMWGFLGDNGKGDVCGTMYYSPSKPINYHWHLYDQVLLRPDLVNDFVDDKLDIITQIGTTNLLTKSDIVDKKYSDHLPIVFRLEI